MVYNWGLLEGIASDAMARAGDDRDARSDSEVEEVAAPPAAKAPARGRGRKRPPAGGKSKGKIVKPATENIIKDLCREFRSQKF